MSGAKRERIERVFVVVLLTCLAVFLCSAVFAQAKTRTSYSVYPATAEYKEDINRDGVVDGADVVSLLTLGKNVPESPVADYNGDGVFSVLDAVVMLLNMRCSMLTPLVPVDTTTPDTTKPDTTAPDTTLPDTTAPDTTSADTTSTQKIVSISGYIYCLQSRIPNVSVIVNGDDFEASTITDASGYYAFRVPPGLYTIIPMEVAAGYGFDPIYRTVQVRELDINRLDFMVYGFETTP